MNMKSIAAVSALAMAFAATTSFAEVASPEVCQFKDCKTITCRIGDDGNVEIFDSNDGAEACCRIVLDDKFKANDGLCEPGEKKSWVKTTTRTRYFVNGKEVDAAEAKKACEQINDMSKVRREVRMEKPDVKCTCDGCSCKKVVCVKPGKCGKSHPKFDSKPGEPQVVVCGTGKVTARASGPECGARKAKSEIDELKAKIDALQKSVDALSAELD